MRSKHLSVLIHIRIKSEAGAVNMFKPSSICFTDHSNAVLLLWMFHVCLCYAVLAVPAGKLMTSLLSCVLRFLVFLSLSHTVFQVKCGT